MGVCNSANIFQEIISELFKGLDMVRAYIDDVLVIIKNEFKDHIKALEKYLQILCRSGIKSKCREVIICTNRN